MSESKTYFTLRIPFTEWGMEMLSWCLCGVLIGITLTLIIVDMAQRKAVRAQEKDNSEAWLKHIRSGGAR